jgi:hypothetical protein
MYKEVQKLLTPLLKCREQSGRDATNELDDASISLDAFMGIRLIMSFKSC